MPEDVCAWFEDQEDRLILGIIEYAKRQGYTEYTSTLVEAWRLSVRELTVTLREAMKVRGTILDFRPEEDFDSDPISVFAVIEAEKHRKRGIELKMFLGLFKYYRQVYLDVVDEGGFAPAERDDHRFFVARVFDRLEIAFCNAWVNLAESKRLRELQRENRTMTNEKNRFLTIAESLGAPVLLFDGEGRVTYLNRAAAQYFGMDREPGAYYYSTPAGDIEVPAWLAALVAQNDGSRDSWRAEHTRMSDEGERVFSVRLQPMLDVSGKFEGTVVIMYEISALREVEKALAEKAREMERLSNTDDLTGLLNRRGLFAVAEDLMHKTHTQGHQLSILFSDVNELKQLNDRFGHVVGDAALVAVANALRRSCRSADVIARVGGDEFVVLLPDSSELSQDEVLKRIHIHLEREMESVEVASSLSLSTGWISYDPEEHHNFDQLLIEADTRMYWAKKHRTSKPS